MLGHAFVFLFEKISQPFNDTSKAPIDGNSTYFLSFESKYLFYLALIGTRFDDGSFPTTFILGIYYNKVFDTKLIT